MRALIDGLSCKRVAVRTDSNKNEAAVTYPVYMKVERGKDRIRIALSTVAFDGCTDERLGEDEVREIMYGQ